MATILKPFEAGTDARANGNGPAVPVPEVVTITPDMAREWTEKNTRNRTVRYAKVAQMARDMKAGEWSLNGETIKLCTDGTVIDGQHRLYACIQAEAPFRTFVVRDLPMSVQDTIDTGATRRMADQLIMRGESDAATLAAIARWLLKWRSGVRGWGSADVEPTHAEMLALIDAEPAVREAAAFAASARGKFKSVSGSTWGMAWLLFHASDVTAAGAFLEKALTGADCSAGDPVLAFRTRIWNARENGERLTQYEQLAYLVLAWNAVRDGRRIGKLQLPKGRLTSKNFPAPK